MLQLSYRGGGRLAVEEIAPQTSSATGYSPEPWTFVRVGDAAAPEDVLGGEERFDEVIGAFEAYADGSLAAVRTLLQPAEAA